MTDEAPAWERRPDESSPQFEAFRRYRDLGPRRTLAAVAEAWSPSGSSASLSRLRAWSRRNDWRQRAAAYDAALDRARVEAALAEAAKLGRDSESVTRAALDLVHDALEDVDLASATFPQLVAAVDRLVRLELDLFGATRERRPATPEPAPAPLPEPLAEGPIPSDEDVAATLAILRDAGAVTLPTDADDLEAAA